MLHRGIYYDYGVPAGLTETTMRAWYYGADLVGRDWVMMLHGHGASPSLYLPPQTSYGDDTVALLRAGLVVFAPDAGGGAAWVGSASTSLPMLDALYLYATDTLGLADTCAMHAVSMGGIITLNWIKRNPEKVRAAMLRAPASNLPYFEANMAYQAQIWAATGSANHAEFLVDSVGWNPLADAADYRGICPMSIFQGDADPTVRPVDSAAFVAAVNDPAVTLTVIPGGVHNLGPMISPSTSVRLLAA